MTASPSLCPVPLVRPGVWCEVISAYSGAPGTAVRRDGYAAPGPGAAVRWIRAGVRTVASVLGPRQAEFVLDWWVDGPGSERACARLRETGDCALTLYPGIQELTWRARPVRFLHLAEVNGRPPCGRRYRPRLLLTGRADHAR
ncbi:hypothetical protein IQ279_16330 [Streptomyces verrucosisporus]|uniref:hypothetical protein n=1 Tax=Streptomyces verrucosisporus TaxID=1695161 RepID=UPI0019D2F52A|nr:hypothetical protein [Streptomyces verrucosisporus]MBN3931179.1 hypothetical protein [Streptomyces verrucosisporus]